MPKRRADTTRLRRRHHNTLPCCENPVRAQTQQHDKADCMQMGQGDTQRDGGYNRAKAGRDAQRDRHSGTCGKYTTRRKGKEKWDLPGADSKSGRTRQQINGVANGSAQRPPVSSPSRAPGPSVLRNGAHLRPRDSTRGDVQTPSPPNSGIQRLHG